MKGIWQSRKVETSRTRPHDKLTTDCTIFGGSTSQLPPHKSRHLQPTCYDLFLGTFLQWYKNSVPQVSHRDPVFLPLSITPFSKGEAEREFQTKGRKGGCPAKGRNTIVTTPLLMAEVVVDVLNSNNFFSTLYDYFAWMYCIKDVIRNFKSIKVMFFEKFGVDGANFSSDVHFLQSRSKPLSTVQTRGYHFRQ